MQFKLEMCGKAQRDSPVLVLLAPTGEYDCMVSMKYDVHTEFHGDMISCFEVMVSAML